MVRNYVRKTNRGSWSAEQIKNAVSAILDKRMSYCLAAKTFGIPKTTLARKIKRIRCIDAKGLVNMISKIPSKPQEEDVQSNSICFIDQSDAYEEEDSPTEAEDYLELPNATKKELIEINDTLDPIEENDNQNINKKEDDICELYGKILAKKLRQVPEHERLEIMYEIDGLLLNKLRRSI